MKGTELDVGGKCSPTSGGLSIDEKVVRSCSQNAMVISYVMLSDMTNKRYCMIMGEVAKPLISWHMKANTETRSTDRTHTWLSDQVDGGYMGHCCEFVALLSDPRVLESAGFALDGPSVDALGSDWQSEDISLTSWASLC